MLGWESGCCEAVVSSLDRESSDKASSQGERGGASPCWGEVTREYCIFRERFSSTCLAKIGARGGSCSAARLKCCEIREETVAKGVAPLSSPC